MAAAESSKKARQAAGWILVAACETVAGNQGPRALSRRGDRGAPWWSRLRAGKGGFPTWPEVVAAVGGSLEEEAERYLRSAYLEAIRVANEAPPAPHDDNGSVYCLRATYELAVRTWVRGDYRGAAAALGCVEALLSGRDGPPHDVDRLKLLADCQADLSTCRSCLGDHAGAVLSARRAVDAYGLAGDRFTQESAEHLVAMALDNAGRHQEAQRILSRVGVHYARHGLPGERVRAEQDLACSLWRQGRVSIAARRLDLLFSETPWDKVPPAHGFQNHLKLAEVSLALHNRDQARLWLQSADECARALAGPLAEHLERHHVRQKRRILRDRVAA